MKIVTWNCNGAFRNKIEPILQFDADIYIIQECEHTEQAKKIYRQYFSNFVWKGNNKNKGIGIFTKDALSLEVLDWQDNKLELFLHIQVNQSFTLLAVWAKHANSPTFAYIGQIWKYLQLHQLKMQNIPLIIGGDFNSNSQWDVWDRWWNHSDVIRIFNDLKIKSLYHHISNEKQGQESQATFFLQRNLAKAYHIDYMFASEQFWKIDQASMQVGDQTPWLSLSDHLPLYFDLAPKFEK